MNTKFYTINYTQHELDEVFKKSNISSIFLHPYHGDKVTTISGFKKKIDWDNGISRIMDQFDEAWRELARL